MAQELVSAGGVVYYGWSGNDDDSDDLATGIDLLTTGMSNRIIFDTVPNATNETVGYLKYSWMGTDTIYNMPYSIAYFRYPNTENKGYKFTIYDSGSGDVYAYFNPSATVDNPEWSGIGSAIWTGGSTGVTTGGTGKQSMCVANIAMTPIGSTNAGATRAIVAIAPGGAPYVYGRDNTSTFTVSRSGLSPDTTARSKITVLGPVFASSCGGVSTHARIPVQKSTPLSPGSYSISGIQYQIVGASNASGLLAIRGNTSTISTS